MQNTNRDFPTASSSVGSQTTNSMPARVTPARITETTFAFSQSCILLAAVELDIFTGIAQGMNTASLLAKRADASELALKRLLDALSAMEFLQRTGEVYALTPVSERFLVRSQETYVGDTVLLIRQEWETWIHLTDIVRTGQPVRFVNEEADGVRFFAPLAESLFPLVYPLMRLICKRLGVGTRMQGAHVLDLGAGAAPEAIAALEMDPDAHAVVMDFPEVLARAQEYAQKHSVNGRIEYVSANLETVELPQERFDLSFASHVFRILGAEITQRLIKQSYQSLKSGGRLIIVETYNEPDAVEKLFPHIISVNMLINTRHGDAFNTKQMHEWLSTAGFQVEVWSDAGPEPVMVATRP